MIISNDKSLIIRLCKNTDLKEIKISKEVYNWVENLEAVCQKNKFYVDGQTTDSKRRKYFLGELQNGFSDYRKSTYDKDSKGDTTLSVNRIITFNKFVLECFKKSIMNNKHNNLFEFECRKKISIHAHPVTDKIRKA